jgi:hypothetical protein
MNKPYKDSEELELLMIDFWKDYYKLKRILDPQIPLNVKTIA